jgi:hypothetical protein
MRDALLKLSPFDDDATAFVPRPTSDATSVDRTPPAGIVPKVSRRRRSLAVPLAVGAVVAVAVGVLVYALSSPVTRGNQSGAAGQAAVPITHVAAFDPFGSGEEHNADVGNLIDGRPNTTWRTKTYFDALPKIKKGVGLIIQSSAAAGHLVVSPGTAGWSAQVYVADQPAATLDGWGAPISSRTGISADTTFSLGNHRGRAVLLWITDLGQGNDSVGIRELRLTG